MLQTCKEGGERENIFTMTFRLIKSKIINSGHDKHCRRKTCHFPLLSIFPLFPVPPPDLLKTDACQDPLNVLEKKLRLMGIIWKPVYEQNTTKETRLPVHNNQVCSIQDFLVHLLLGTLVAKLTTVLSYLAISSRITLQVTVAPTSGRSWESTSLITETTGSCRKAQKSCLSSIVSGCQLAQ